MDQRSTASLSTAGRPEGRRVLVVSAGMGSGHHAAADELVRRLLRAGHVAERIDVLELGRPGQGARLRATYGFLLRRLPWVYDLAMRFWARWPGPLERLTAHGAAAFEGGLLSEVARTRADLVVSVYNLSSQALGRLRADGRLRVPVATYATDPAAHPYWVHRGVDLHLAVLPEAARAMAARGARRTVCVAPLVAPAFARRPTDRESARRNLGLPGDAVVALVSGGSWAAGRLERTVARLAGHRDVLPVTLCGRNRGLRARLDRRGAGVALGWTDDMPGLFAAADVLVDNAGGLTCWEALTTGLPVVVAHPLPGHGRLNARALEEAGLAPWARADGDLVRLVRAAAAGRAGWRPDPVLATAPDPLQPLLDLLGRGRVTVAG